MQTTKLRRQLAGWQSSLYTELQKFPQVVIKKKVLELLYRENEIEMRTIVDSMLLNLFEEEELIALFQRKELKLLESVILAIDKEYYTEISDCFSQLKEKVGKKLSKSIKDTIFEIIDENNLDKLESLLENDVISILSEEDYTNLLQNPKTDLFNLYIKIGINKPSGSSIFNFCNKPFFNLRIFNENYNLLKHKVISIIKDNNEDEVIALVRLRLFDYITDEDFSIIFDLSSKELLLKIYDISFTYADDYEGYEWGHDFVLKRSHHVREHLIQIMQKKDFKKFKSYLESFMLTDIKREEYLKLIEESDSNVISFFLDYAEGVEINWFYEDIYLYPYSEFDSPPERLLELLVEEIKKNNMKRFHILDETSFLDILSIEKIETTIQEKSLNLDEKILKRLKELIEEKKTSENNE